MNSCLSIVCIICSGLLLSNPFYFAEDILYGDNNPKKDFGIYEIVIGPGNHDFIEWNITLGAIFDRKIGKEWPSSIKNHITEHSFLIENMEHSFFTIKKKDFAPFKRKLKQFKRKKDGYIEKFKFCYLDADSGIMLSFLERIPSIDAIII